MSWDDGLEAGSPAYNLASSNENVIRSLAGPGSGKSFAIKRRIAKMIEGGIPPEKILAITFTRTSAADLRKEIASIELEGIERVLARTVHSHAMSILLQAAVQEITERSPRIILEHEISPAFRDIENPLDLDVNQKKKMLKAFTAGWATLQNEAPGFPRNESEAIFETELIEWLKWHQALRVDEVITIALRYLRNNPACPEIGKYRAILVDEYQDLNKAEQEFIRQIKGNATIVIVGDDDQSIYGFKFAHPEGIRAIDTLYGESFDISFNVIRRCPKRVTLMASELISKNPNRTLGKLIPYANNQEGTVEIVQWGDDGKEINGLAKIIKHEIEAGNISPGDILVLSPRRKIGYKLRDKLLLEHIAVKSYFREDVISKDKVKRAYSLLYLFAFPDDKISIRFLLGCTSFDYRRNQYKYLRQYATEQNLSLREALDKILSERLKIKGITTIIQEYRKILTDLNAIRQKLLEDPKSLFECFNNQPDDESDFYELSTIYTNIINNYLDDDGEPNADNISIWFSKIMQEIVESIAMPDSPEEINHVRIMSLHAAKGLSAKFVILTSMIEGLMPSLNQDLTAEEQQKAIEEQRRLFYVAITRCKSSETDYPGRLIISSFIQMNSNDAKKMKIPARNSTNTQMSATRFLRDFGRTSPTPIRGDSLLQTIGSPLRPSIAVRPPQ